MPAACREAIRRYGNLNPAAVHLEAVHADSADLEVINLLLIIYSALCFSKALL